ncbi:PKD domain-containing protein [Hyunsoonleella rubra]|uniref:PKD domain-containing protein n=1 Tax=Hyunsoonleella rubra TaxID=1737062 RepID=A0ABW5TCN1_9FLAO
MNFNGNTSNHLDKKVIYVFLATFLVSITVFALRYASYSPCVIVDFDIKANEYVTGGLIKFKDNTEGADSWLWDFGDESISSTEQDPIHNYSDPGEYTIKLLVNNSCEFSKQIVIKKKKEIKNEAKFPIFNIPKNIRVGQTLWVEDESDHGKTWEWHFGETPSAGAFTKKAKYVYQKPGKWIVSLVVNGDLEHIATREIEVFPKKRRREIIDEIPDRPSAPPLVPKSSAIDDKPVVEKTVPFISHPKFRELIMKVSEEGLPANTFRDYFCGNLDTPVIVNGEETTFLILCEKIKGKKIKKIRSLELFRNKGSNCIVKLTISYKKSGWF